TVRAAAPLAAEICLGRKVSKPEIERLHPTLRSFGERLAGHVQRHTRAFKLASKRLEEAIVGRQAVQARLADNATLMYACACVLSKLDQQMARNASGPRWERDKAAGLYFLHMAHEQIEENLRRLDRNSDAAMDRAAVAALDCMDTMPNGNYYIHEASPTAKGTGHPVHEAYVKQFPG